MFWEGKNLQIYRKGHQNQGFQRFAKTSKNAPKKVIKNRQKSMKNRPWGAIWLTFWLFGPILEGVGDSQICWSPAGRPKIAKNAKIGKFHISERKRSPKVVQGWVMIRIWRGIFSRGSRAWRPWFDMSFFDFSIFYFWQKNAYITKTIYKNACIKNCLVAFLASRHICRKEWRLFCIKEKSIYATLNMFEAPGWTGRAGRDVYE